MKDLLIRELRINPSGLVWAYEFHNGTTTEISPADDLGQRLNQHFAIASGKLLWLHFNLSQASTERWLRGNTPLPP